MTVDERLRDALRRRADAVVPSQPEWSRVAGRLSPPARRYRRVAFPSVVGAVVVVVAAVLVSVNGSDGPRSVGTAGLPGSSVAPAPTTTLAAPTTTLAPVPTTTVAPVPTTTAPTAAPGPTTGEPVPAGFQPISVTWVSTLRGWALGLAECGNISCAVLLRTTDGGARWTGVPGIPLDGAVARGVRFSDERNGWVFGLDIWATHDGGATWRHVDSPRGLVSSLEAAGGRVWAVVQSTEHRLFTAPVGTDDWQPAGSDPVPTARIADRPGELSGTEIALQGATGYVAGADGVVRALSAAGLEPRGAPCGNRGGPLAVSGTSVFALCATGPAAGSSTKTLMLSTDGARTWSPVGSPPLRGIATSVAAASPSTIVVAAGGGASLLYLSQDGGRTWTIVYEAASLGGLGFHDLGFTTVSHGVALAYSQSDVPNRLLVTSDGGRTWSPGTFGR